MSKNSLSFFLSGLALLCASGVPLFGAYGGPDAAGYSWIDEAEPGCSIDGHGFTSAPGTVDLSDEAVSPAIPLPFLFPFYGQTYASLYVTSNGLLTFVDPAGDPFPDNRPIPDPPAPRALIAAYWDDLDPSGSLVRYGYVASDDLFLLAFTGVDNRYGEAFSFFVELYRDGSFKIIYVGLPHLYSATLGIEDRDGAQGLMLAFDGWTAPGLRAQEGVKALCFLPPSGLDCSAASPVACPSSTQRTPLPGDTDSMQAYACSTKRYPGEEALFLLDLGEASTVDLSLSGFDPAQEDLDLFLMRLCDPQSCMLGGTDAIDTGWLPAGTYLLAVDSPDAGDLAAFTLDVSCSGAVAGTLSCNGPALAGSSSGLGLRSAYPGCTDQDLQGPEALYRFDLPAPGNAIVEVIPDGPQRFEILVFDEAHLQVMDTLEPRGSDCLAQGSRFATLYDRPGSYVAVVDSPDLGGGGFTVRLTCPPLAVEDVNCGLSLAPGSLSGPGLLDGFPCSPISLAGPEKVYRVAVGAGENLSAQVTPVGPDDLWLQLFDREPFTPDACVAASPGALSAFRPNPGMYYLVVDNPLDASADFMLDLGCPTLDPAAIDCGATVSGATQGLGVLSRYGCTAKDLAGPERLFEVILAQQTNLRAFITHDAGIDLDLLVFDAQDVNLANCLAHGDQDAAVYGLPPGAYRILVDGTAGSIGNFELTATCRTDLDCATNPPAGAPACPADRLDGQNTAAGALQVSDYACTGLPGIYDGPELIYTVDLPQGGNLLAVLENRSADLDLFLLAACDEGSCRTHEVNGMCADDLPAGSYYLVVDSIDPAGGGFDLVTECIDPPQIPMNHWSVCEPPVPPTTPGTHAASEWRFNSETYCGTFCNFAMYIAPECGTELHIPLWDVESGHMRVWSYEQQDYVYLIADNGLDVSDPSYWGMEGTDIAWSAFGCPLQDGPGSPAENDPRFNDRLMDIRFLGTPTLCGVFRLEFLSWGGFHWELYANCSGERKPGFAIYDSYCRARKDFTPMPELTIAGAGITGDCENVEVDFAVLNIGCTPVSDVPVKVETEFGDLWETTIPTIASGDRAAFAVPFAVNTPPMDITITVDPLDVILECNESGQTSVSCFPPGTADSVTLTACADPCEIDTVPPPVPVGNVLMAVKPSFDSAQLEWPAGPDPDPIESDHFHLYRSTAKADPGAVISPEGQTTKSYTDASLPLDLYFYRVYIADGCENEAR